MNKLSLKGLSPHDDGMEKAFERCYKIAAEDPNKKVLIDIESGWPYIVSKEQYDDFMNMWEATKPKITDSKLSGKLIVFGTGGGLNNKNKFEDLFKDGI